MEEIFLDKLTVTALTLVLVLVVYWTVEYIKLVLKGKLNDIYIQPISLGVGTIVASFVMYSYNYTPVDLGTARWEIVNYFVQGLLLTALSGVLYDKFLDKGEEGTTSTSVELNVEKTETV